MSRDKCKCVFLWFTCYRILLFENDCFIEVLLTFLIFCFYGCQELGGWVGGRNRETLVKGNLLSAINE